jgi:hypothetical protein
MYAHDNTNETLAPSNPTTERMALLRVRVEYLTNGMATLAGETLTVDHGPAVADVALALLDAQAFTLSWALDNPYKATCAAATKLGYL